MPSQLEDQRFQNLKGAPKQNDRVSTPETLIILHQSKKVECCLQTIPSFFFSPPSTSGKTARRPAATGGTKTSIWKSVADRKSETTGLYQFRDRIRPAGDAMP